MQLPRSIFLFNKGVTIDFCTARPFNLWTTTSNWFKNKNINFSRITFIDHKDRLDYIKQRELKFFVEDRLETALDLQSITNTYLVDAPYNQYEYKTNFIRIKNKEDWIKFQDTVLEYKD